MVDDEERSATAVLSDFLRGVRGPPTEIEEFEIIRPEASRKVKSQVEATAAESRSNSSGSTTVTPHAAKTSPAADTILETEASPAADKNLETDTSPETDTRLTRMRVAALVAVLSLSGASPASRADVGRRLGSSWAEDHRRRRMGLTGLASRRSQRARWR